MSQPSPVLKSAAVESRRPWRGCRSLQNNRSKPNTPRSEGPGAALQIPRWLVFWFCGAVAELLSEGATIQKEQPRPSRAEFRAWRGGREEDAVASSQWLVLVCLCVFLVEGDFLLCTNTLH